MTEPLPAFALARPHDIAAALAARREHKEGRFLAGGTDLLVNMRRGIGAPSLLIDLSQIEELQTLTVSDRGACIGAGVTLATLAAESAIQGRYRAVAEAAAAIAGPAHRTAATVGGNLCLDTRCVYYNQSQWWRQSNNFCLKHGGDICHVAPQGERCHAAFSGDLAPALLVCGAELEIAAASGRRRVPLADIYVEDGRAHLALAADELIVAVHLPPNAPPSAYEKVRVRGAIDFPLAGVAVALAADGGKVTSLRVGLTGTNSRPFLLAGTEDLVGKALDAAALQSLERMVQKQVQPMRTTLVSSNYRRVAAAALAKRLAVQLHNDSKGP
jgi:4-hydroxybenzoyl-CoA reductase subunit beta